MYTQIHAVTIFCFKSVVHKFWAPGHSGKSIFYGGPKYLWVLSMELASSHTFGAKKFEVSPGFL